MPKLSKWTWGAAYLNLVLNFIWLGLCLSFKLPYPWHNMVLATAILVVLNFYGK